MRLLSYAVATVGFLMSGAAACGAFGGSDATSATETQDAGGADLDLDGGTVVVEDGRATKDANVPVNDPCPDAGPHRFMFVTNATYRGDLGRDAGTTGRAVADTHCNDAARAVGLPGTYVAWLSTTNDHPPVNPMVGVAIVMPRACEVLAADQVALSSATTLPTAPTSTELGGTLSDPCYVWSNTSRSGTSFGSTSCEEWTTVDSGVQGSVGACDNVDYQWSTWGALQCDNGNAHLYCLQN